MRICATLSAFALLGLVSTAAQGQRTVIVNSQQTPAENPIELGVDAQLSFGLDDQGTAFSLPLPKIRAGFVIAPAMTIEPALGFFRFSSDNVSASTTVLDVSLLYHFGLDRAVRQYYVRPVFGIQREAAKVGDVSDATTFMNLGVAGGVKIPLMDRVATRLEAEFRNQLEKDGVPSMSALNLNFGVSFFTR